jgi:hypothetical protein
MNLVKENLYEFTRGNDPLDTLNIGYAAKIHKFFDDLDIDRRDYTVEGKQIIFKDNLNLGGNSNLIKLPNNLKPEKSLFLSGCINLIELPDNLDVNDSLYLSGCTSLVKLPDNLTVGINLNLRNANIIKELPNDLWVGNYIHVNRNQKELIKWIKNSKFEHNLIINES